VKQEDTMASICKQLVTSARPESVWDAIRDIGALHTRLVPGFVVDTRVEPGARARVVTFANGTVIKEPIVTIDDDNRRLVWSAEGGALTHYNASAQVFSDGAGSRVVWLADFLPPEAAQVVGPMMEQGMAAMKKALDQLARSDL
jgi:carbon monoxide dehydrogenase subunit G